MSAEQLRHNPSNRYHRDGHTQLTCLQSCCSCLVSGRASTQSRHIVGRLCACFPLCCWKRLTSQSDLPALFWGASLPAPLRVLSLPTFFFSHLLAKCQPSALKLEPVLKAKNIHTTNGHYNCSLLPLSPPLPWAESRMTASESPKPGNPLASIA